MDEILKIIEKARNLTGVEDPNKLGTLLASAGIPATLIVSGPEVVAVRMEHTWAEALVDYDPYAGAKAGEGDLWVPLSPWYKPHEYVDGVDLVQMSGSDAEVVKVENINDIMGFGVMMTPALAIDGDVKVSGKIPSPDQIAEWINEAK